MTKYIHIHAKCNYFEIFELVPENKSVARLVKIRENYIWSKIHNNVFIPKRGKVRMEMNQSDKLSVKTCVVNPELPFIY